MTVNEMAGWLDDACYGFLAANFLWGLYCVLLIWRRVVQLRFRSADEESAFVTELRGLIKAGDFTRATEMCDYDFRALPRICLLMLTNRKLDYAQLRQLVVSSMQRQILADLEYRMSWIVTVIKSGPLLGLFGTVLGMMAAFGRIGTGEKIQPSQIADEISIALICTAMGLGTAIPLGYVLAGMQIRVRLLQESLEDSVARILDVFRSRAS